MQRLNLTMMEIAKLFTFQDNLLEETYTYQEKLGEEKALKGQKQEQNKFALVIIYWVPVSSIKHKLVQIFIN